MTDQLVRSSTRHYLMVGEPVTHVVMAVVADDVSDQQDQRHREHGDECWVEEPGGARHRRHHAHH